MDQAMDPALKDFLGTKGLTSGAALDVIVGAGYDSLPGLRLALGDTELREDLLSRLGEHALALRVVEGLGVGVVDNAIHFQDPAARADGRALEKFLVGHAVATSGSQVQELLFVMREAGIDSLAELKKLKARPAPVQSALTTAISQAVDVHVADRFAALTASAVSQTMRGGPPEVTPELKGFLERRGLPGGADAELAGFGITTLAQLRAVKEGDKAGLKALQAQLEKSGIVAVTKQFDSIEVDDIEQEMAETASPEVKGNADRKRRQLADAIEQVESLRQDVEQVTDGEFAAVRSEVESRYQAVLDAIKDVSGAEFDRAAVRSTETRKGLATMLATTISSATTMQDVLEGVDKAPRSLARMIRQQDVLCGFLITPAGATRRYSAVMRLPDNPQDLARDPGMQRSVTHTYEGNHESSFAASTARHASSTLATSSRGSVSGFVGSGIAAVSVAASYAKATMSSEDRKAFMSSTTTECGEIHYIYVPKQVVQFNRRDVQLSDDARAHLADIVAAPEEQRDDAVLAFFDEYGSHVFMQCSLGGRYQFTATGRAKANISTGQLVTAVADTTNWAASASASYSGIGATATVSTAVNGDASVASARGDRFALDFTDASVDVTVEVLGGAGLAPRDVWGQSLQYSSTWAVIDRDRPLAVWELLSADASLARTTGSLAPLLERVWVQKVFLPALAQAQPALYQELDAPRTLSTCSALDSAIATCLSRAAAPEFRIKVVTATSGRSSGPTALAALSERHYKLIGGGAHVDPGTGAPDRNYLIGSYPDGKGWVAQSHDHNSVVCEATVTSYAIYLYDPHDDWDVAMRSTESGYGSRPKTTAVLPEGYHLTGGGARVQLRGKHGLFLTSCHPALSEDERGAWTAAAKDAWVPGEGKATSWVFGVRPKSGVAVSASRVEPTHASGASPQAGGTSHPGEVVVGGGARIQSGEGLLTSTSPGEGEDQWRYRAYAEGEGHTSTLWVISRPGRLTTDPA